MCLGIIHPVFGEKDGLGHGQMRAKKAKAHKHDGPANREDLGHLPIVYTGLGFRVFYTMEYPRVMSPWHPTWGAGYFRNAPALGHYSRHYPKLV
jgi:hypothetical protein